MKKLILALCVMTTTVVLSGANAERPTSPQLDQPLTYQVEGVAEKEFTLKFSESNINKHWNKLNTTKQIIDQSNLPYQSAKFILGTIDSLQMEIQIQVMAQNRPDSTKKK